MRAAIDLFSDYISTIVANGNASKDTSSGYQSQLRAWLRWCKAHCLQPIKATAKEVTAYRADLVQAGYKPASIAHKLAALVQFYKALQTEGLRLDNPAEGIAPPMLTRATEDFPALDQAALQQLLDVLPSSNTPDTLRDRALILLLALHGLRTVEIHRASVHDLQRRPEGVALLVHGKGNQQRLLWLRPDVAEHLAAYLAARGKTAPDAFGVPLFTAAQPRAGARIERRGIRKIVDHYLKSAGLKSAGVSAHALRHTAATLAYQHTHDIRAVQEMLGHSSPQTTSRYAQLVDAPQRNPALAVPIWLPPAQ